MTEGEINKIIADFMYDCYLEDTKDIVDENRVGYDHFIVDYTSSLSDTLRVTSVLEPDLNHTALLWHMGDAIYYFKLNDIGYDLPGTAAYALALLIKEDASGK